MTKHRPSILDTSTDLLNKFAEFSRGRDELSPELIGIFSLFLASVVFGIRAWLQI